MLDRYVDLGLLVRFWMWFWAVVLVASDLFARWTGTGELRDLGLVLAIAAATMTVKARIDKMERSQRNAFELGRDSRRIRSVEGDH